VLNELVGLSLASRSGVGLESEILLGPDIGSHLQLSLDDKLFAVERKAEGSMESHIRADEILFSLFHVELISVDAKRRQTLD